MKNNKIKKGLIVVIITILLMILLLLLMLLIGIFKILKLQDTKTEPVKETATEKVKETVKEIDKVKEKEIIDSTEIVKNVEPNKVLEPVKETATERIKNEIEKTTPEIKEDEKKDENTKVIFKEDGKTKDRVYKYDPITKNLISETGFKEDGKTVYYLVFYNKDIPFTKTSRINYYFDKNNLEYYRITVFDEETKHIILEITKNNNHEIIDWKEYDKNTGKQIKK